jgi:hypothetical protein
MPSRCTHSFGLAAICGNQALKKLLLQCLAVDSRGLNTLETTNKHCACGAPFSSHLVRSSALPSCWDRLPVDLVRSLAGLRFGLNTATRAYRLYDRSWAHIEQLWLVVCDQTIVMVVGHMHERLVLRAGY